MAGALVASIPKAVADLPAEIRNPPAVVRSTPDHGPMHQYAIPALMGSVLADLITTEQALARSGTRELNPLGQTAAARWGLGLGVNGLAAFLADRYLYDKHPKAAQALMYVMAAPHVVAAVHNTRQGR